MWSTPSRVFLLAFVLFVLIRETTAASRIASSNRRSISSRQRRTSSTRSAVRSSFRSRTSRIRISRSTPKPSRSRTSNRVVPTSGDIIPNWRRTTSRPVMPSFNGGLVNAGTSCSCARYQVCSGGNCLPKCTWGYSWSSLYSSCKDIDECSRSPCKSNQKCTNTHGSYTCSQVDRSGGTFNSVGSNRAQSVSRPGGTFNSVGSNRNQSVSTPSGTSNTDGSSRAHSGGIGRQRTSNQNSSAAAWKSGFIVGFIVLTRCVFQDHFQ